MSIATSIITRCFDVQNGELKIGGILVRELATQFGTPMYIYDSHLLDEKIKCLRKTLPEHFDIYYSVKANPNMAIIKHFLSQGCGLEIASAGEFNLARRAGCDLSKIIFAGPSKTVAELEQILPDGIEEIHVESELEIRRIESISSRLGIKTPVALRVNPTGAAEGGAMRMGGKATQFGIDEECLDPALDAVLSANFLEFKGIHVYSGTQILDYKILLRQYRKGLEIARQISKRLARALETVDFGGGLGIPYFSNESELDMDGFRAGLAELISDINKDPLFEGTRFIVEPGRYLVGESGVYVTTVNDIKISRGKKFLILDGGMNHHLAASGNLGQVIKRNFPISLVEKLDQESIDVVNMVGPLCTPLDTLAKDITVPLAEVGDLVGIFQSGAYGLTASPLGFLSHRAPPEVMIDDRGAQLIRSCEGNKEIGMSSF